MKSHGRSISLHDELLELDEVLEAVRVLAHLLAVEGFDEPDEAHRAPRVIEAVAGFAKGRLELICRCLRGEVDPRLLLAAHNEVTGAPPPEDWTDTVLRTWEPRENRRTVKKRLKS